MTNLDSLLPARRGRNGEATSRRILVAAEAEFAAKGFDGARLSAIARMADVQQALIHHYFGDKEGLYREVIDRALTAIADVGWRILGEMARRRSARPGRSGSTRASSTPSSRRSWACWSSSTPRTPTCCASSGTRRPAAGPLADELVRMHVKPQLDDVVARFEDMRRRGEVRADVDPRHLCVSTVAMACFPNIEEAFLKSVWSLDPRAPAFVATRKQEIVKTVMARIAPSP